MLAQDGVGRRKKCANRHCTYHAQLGVIIKVVSCAPRVESVQVLAPRGPHGKSTTAINGPISIIGAGVEVAAAPVSALGSSPLAAGCSGASSLASVVRRTCSSDAAIVCKLSPTATATATGRREGPQHTNQTCASRVAVAVVTSAHEPCKPTNARQHPLCQQRHAPWPARGQAQGSRRRTGQTVHPSLLRHRRRRHPHR